MNKLLSLIALLTLFATINLSGQGDDCSTAVPFCTDSGVTFPAGVDNGISQPIGNSYDCGTSDLFTQPNAAWYYLEIANGGDLNIDLTSDPAEDIDFALWGPYPNIATAQGQCGSLPDPIDCSFASASTEQANITGASSGEVYLLMITNFSNNPTDITAELTPNSTGTTDCSIIMCEAEAGTITATTTGGGSGNNLVLCEGESASLISNDDYILPPALVVEVGGEEEAEEAEEAELMYAIYNCAPPGNPNPDNDGCFSGLFWTAEDFNATNAGTFATNNGGFPQAYIDAGITGTNGTVWMVPITMDDSDNGGNPNGDINIDGDGDGCWDAGTPISISYPDIPTVQITPNCDPITGAGSIEVLVNGNGSFNVNETGAGNTTGNTNNLTDGDIFTIINLSDGDAWAFSLTGGGCSTPFTGTFSCSDAICLVDASITADPPASAFPGGLYPPNTTVNFCVDIGQYNQSNVNFLHGIVPSFGNGWTNIQEVQTPAVSAVLEVGSFWEWNAPNTVSINTSGAPITDWGWWFYSINSPGGLPSDPDNGWGDGCSPLCYDGTNQATCEATGFGLWLPDDCGCVGINGGLWVGPGLFSDIDDPTMDQPTCEDVYGGIWDAVFTVCVFPDNETGGPVCLGNAENGSNLSWEACFSLTTTSENACLSGQNDLSVFVTTYADGVTGGWTDPGCLSDDTIDAELEELCCITDPSETTDPTFCENESVMLTGNGSGSGILTWYQDATGGTPVGTGSPLNIGELAPGSYTYYLEEDNNGCTSDRIQVSFTVNPLPVIDIVNGNQVICSNNPGSVNISVSSTNPVSWSPSGSGNSISVNPSVSTVYTAISTNGCGSSSVQIAVQVLSPPTAVISGTDDLCGDNSGDLTILLTGIAPWDITYSVGGSPTTITLNTSDVIDNGNNTFSYVISSSIAGDYTITSVTDGTGCGEVGSGTGVINPCCVTPVLNNPGNQDLCVAYTLPTPITGTDLTGNEAYYNDSQANGGTVINLPYTISSGTETIWIYDGVSGCEDEVSFTVTVNIPLDITETADLCPGDTYTASTGTEYTTSGSETFTDVNGCTATLTVTITPITPLDITETADLCPGDTYTASTGTEYTTSGSETFTDVNGCTATLTVTITPITPLDITETADLCPGDTYTASTGTEYTTSGSETFTDVNGCTATLTVTITPITPLDITETADLCPGDTYTASTGTEYTTSGSETFTDVNGCTATLTVTITPLTPLDITETADLCNGDTYTASTGTEYTTSGSETFTDVNGCTATLAVTITPLAPLDITETADLCNGDTYTASTGTEYTTSGSETFTDVNGCTATLTVTITPITPLDITETADLCNGDTYTASTGTEYTTSGSETFTDVNGCTATLTVTITPITPLDITETADLCNGDTYTASTGTEYTTSGSETFTDVNGCTATLTVTITPITPLDITETADLCSGDTYTASTGTEYTTSGSETFTDVNGCTATLTVTITPLTPLDNTETADLCPGDTYTASTGTEYTTSGSETFTDVNGCTATLTVTITPLTPLDNTETADLCPGDTYTASTGTEYTTSGSETFTDVNGCTATLTVTITPLTPLDITETADLCNGDTYTASTGTEYTTSGSETFTDVNGCTATLTVTITPITPLDITETADLCNGDTYTASTGTEYTTSGSETFTDVNGCTATLTVTITPITPLDITETADLCNGDTYTASTGTEYTTSGSETFTDVNGCTATLTVTITPITPLDITETADLCNGDTYTASTGTEYTTSGSETFTDVNGCTATLTVTITPITPLDITETADLCPGDTYTASTGTEYTTSGSETFTDVNGCTATLTVAITPITPLDITETADLCPGDTYTASTGTEYTTSGSETFTDVNGCTATLTVSITPLTPLDITETADLCPGDTYTASTGTEYTTSGSETFTDVNGCTATLSCVIIPLSNDDPTFTLTDFCLGSPNSATITGTSGGAFSIISPNNGAIINGVTAEITNESIGIYTIEYTTGGACPTSSTNDVEVFGIDDASFTLTDFCEGEANSATNIATPGGTFMIISPLGDGASVDATGQITNGAVDVTYEIEYTTTGACSNIQSEFVTVNSLEDASFTFDSFCEGETNAATITGDIGGEFSLIPPFGAASINPLTGSITNAEGGIIYTVQYTTSGTCSDATTIPVIVSSPDIATISIADFCAGNDSQSAVITGVTGGTFAFNPFPGGGTNINPITGIISNGVAGVTYFVDYTTPITGCSITTSTQVTAQASANAGTTEPAPSFCEGDETLVNLTTLLTDEDASGTWNSDTDGSINISNPTQVDISTLGAGTYEFTYTVTATAPCPDDAATVSIIINPEPVVTDAVIVDVLCNGDNTGSISLTVTGNNLDYDWTGVGVVDGLANQAGLGAGNYSVIIEDLVTGCSITDNFTVNEPDNLTIDCTNPTNETSDGAADGTVTVVFGGGTSTYSVSYQGAGEAVVDLGASNSPLLIENLPPNDYTVVVTDANGCMETCTFTINPVGCDLSIDFDMTPVVCAGQATGEINITVGGTPNGSINYNWAGTGTVNNQEDQVSLTAGDYFVTVSDDLGCMAILNLEVTEPDLLSIINITDTNTNCGLDNGSLTITANGGTGTIQYSVDGSIFGTNNIFNDLSSGNHTVIVQDALGCEATEDIMIIADGNPIINDIIVVNSTCGEATGSIEIIASDGFGILMYSINGGTDFTVNNTFNGLSAGSYNVVVQDENNCEVQQVVNIIDDGSPIIDDIVIVNSTCGLATGSITVSASGGQTPYSFSIINNLTGVTINGTSNVFEDLSAGTYTVIVEDNNTCEVTETVVVSDDGSPVIDDIVVNPASCGNNTGSITVTASGGIAPLTYALVGVVEPGTANNVFDNLAAGNYTIIVEDNTGCQITSPVNVGGNSSPVIADIIIEDATCGVANGTCEIIITNGTPDYTYSIDGGVTTETTAATSILFEGLAENTNLDILVTDANGCDVTDIGVVGGIPAQTIDDVILTHTTCGEENGVIEIIASGGTEPYLYSINGGISYFPSNIFNNVAAGDHDVTVLDDNSCFAIQFVTIEDSELPNIDDIIITPSACDLSIGALEILASGGVPPYMYGINGNPLQASNLFENLPTGNHTILVTDANDCATTTTIVLGELDAITLNCEENSPVTTLNGNEGVGEVSIGGGTAPYSVDWGFGPLVNQAAGVVLMPDLVCGNYTVIVTDANGCTESCDFTINCLGCNLTISEVEDAHTNVSCNGDANGSLEVIIEGATGVIDYTWLPDFGDTNILTDLPAGVYNLTAVDETGCDIVISIEIEEPDVLVLDCSTITDASFSGATDGEGQVIIAGGTAPYMVVLNANPAIDVATAGAVTFDDLSANTYTVVVTDANGCEETCSFIISEGDCTIAISSEMSSNVSCNGDNDGTIDIVIADAIGVVTYDWTPAAANSGNLTGLAAGVYTLVATDESNCSTTTTITITEPDALVLDCSTVSNVSVPGGNDGEGQVIITGGTAPYMVVLNANPAIDVATAGAVTFDDLSANTYTVVVTDANGCEETCSFIISEGDCTIAISSEMSSNVSCNGDNDGTIDIVIADAIGVVTYDWTPAAANSGNLTGLAAGVYTLVATDESNCSSTTTITITEPDALVLDCSTVSDVSVPGGNDGEGQVIIAGGAAPYIVVLDANPAIDVATAGAVTFDNLSANTYTVVVTDANGCEETCTFIISEGDCTIAISSEMSSNVSCNGDNDGTIDIVIADAIGVVTYDWTPAAANSGNLTGLAAGVYTLVATDESNCFVETTITITEPDAILLSCEATAPATNGNNDGSGQITIEGGNAPYSVNINNGAIVLDNQVAGIAINIIDLTMDVYNVLITDANGCEETCSFTISELNCALSTANIQIGDCDGQGTLADPNDDIFNVTVDISAENGGTQVMVNSNSTAGPWGPFAYGNILIDNLPADGSNITLTFTDIDNPTCTTLVMVSQTPCSECSLTADSGMNQVISCATSDVPLSGNSNEAGVNYNWTNATGFDENGQNITTNIAGWYYLTVTNSATGCAAIDSVFVDVSDDIPTATGTTNGILNCDTNEVIITGSTSVPNADYSWSINGIVVSTEQTVTVNEVGFVILTVTNTDNDCESPPTPIEVMGDFETPIVIIQDVEDELNCATITTGITLDGTGSSVGSNINYQWSLDGVSIEDAGSMITLQIFGEGEYTFTVIDNLNGCIDSTSVNIIEAIAYPIAAAGETMNITCTNTTVTLDGTASDDFENVTYAWTGPVGGITQNATTTTPTVGLPGEYFITVVDTSNMCTNIDSVMVNEDITPPTVVLSDGFIIDCVVMDGTLDGTGSSVGNNFIYQWNINGENVVGATSLQLDVNQADTYTLLITNTDNGCTNDESVEVLNDPMGPPFPVLSAIPPTCFGESNGSVTVDTIIGGQAPYLFSFESQNFTSSSTFFNLAAGEYEVIVEDARGCQDVVKITVADGNSLALDLGENQLIELGDSLEIEVQTSVPLSTIDTIMWTEIDTSNCLNCFDPIVMPYFTTTYSAQIVDENGCTALDFMTVVVSRDLNVFVPSAFSPDNDGINDVLMVFAGDQVVKVNAFQIFDRWGENVFEYYNFLPNDPAFGWNGIYNSTALNNQVFAYYIEVELIDGTTELLKGDFTLFR